MTQAKDNPSSGGAITPDDERAALGRGGVFGIDTPLVRAVGLSLILHALLMFGAHSIGPADVTFDVDIRESRGVALMAQIGYAPSSETDEGEFAEVDQLPEEGDDTESENDIEPSDGSGGAPEPTDAETESETENQTEEESETDSETETEAPETETETETESETVPVIPPDNSSENNANNGSNAPAEEEREPTPPRRDDSENSNEPSTENNGGEEAGEGEPEVDPADLPPRRRYPEGTVNPVATDVGMWGPEGAASVALIRSDRIRSSPHRDAVTTIFSALGDYRDLADRTNIDPIEDVDVMLLASTDVSDSSRTFVAAVHHLDAGYLMSELSRGYPTGVNWEERNGRYYGTPGAAGTLPRRFVVPTEQLLIYTRPEFIDPLLSDAPRPRGLEGALEPADTPAPPPELEAVLIELGLPEERPEEYDGSNACVNNSGPSRRRCEQRAEERGERRDRDIAAYDTQREALLPQAQAQVDAATEAYNDARRSGIRNRADREPPVRTDESWIRGLIDVGDLAGTGSSGPAILWTFNGFASFNLGGLRRGTEAPQQLVAALELERNPELRARFVFADQAAAEHFRDQWGDVVDHYTFPLTAAGLLRAFRNAEWEIDQNEAIATIAVPASSMGRLATAVRMLGG